MAAGPRTARDTLADVYLASDERFVPTSSGDDLPSCAVEHRLQRKVTSVMEEIERSLIERLSKTTLSEVQDLPEPSHG